MDRSGLAGMGHLARRPLFRLRNPRRPRQVFLRVARRAHRLHGELQGLLRAERRLLRRVLAQGQPGRALTHHRQRHRQLPRPVLAGHARRRGFPHAHRHLRPRLSHRERAEDVEIARDLHQGAQLSRPPQPGIPALLLRSQIEQPYKQTKKKTKKNKQEGGKRGKEKKKNTTKKKKKKKKKKNKKKQKKTTKKKKKTKKSWCLFFFGVLFCRRSN